jgi:excinuclease UvrABC nuclease subunit
MSLNWIGAYSLNQENVDRHVPANAGIYRISIRMKDKSLKVVYVGQSDDLRQRIHQYLNEDTENSCLLNHLRNHIPYFCVAEVSTQAERDAGERALFEHFSPECNDPDKIPDVRPSDINFFND